MTGYWIEEKDGVKYFCFKFRHHGKYHIHRLTLNDLTRLLS